MSGRLGSVEKSPQGIFLVYDKSTDWSQDIWIVSMDTKLRELWKSPMLNVKSVITPFKFTTDCNNANECIVLGRKNNGIYLAKVNTKGKAAWTFCGEKIMRSLYYDIVISPSGEILVVSAVIGDSKKGNKEVKLVKFKELRSFPNFNKD